MRNEPPESLLTSQPAAGPSPDLAPSRPGGRLPRWFALPAPGPHRWFVGCAAICVLAFAAIITGGTGRFVARESFGDFYDYQAISLLHGRLDVPYEAITFESFASGGKHYGYFGPTPALFRIPFVLAGVGFGELSRLLFVAYYAAALVAAYLLLLHAVEVVRGDGARPGPWAVGVFVLGTGLGSTLFFLGSRAYLYHEAILCGTTFALWGVWCALRHLAAPAGRWWIGSVGCGLLSVHARPPSGLFALATLGCVALIIAGRERRQARAEGRPLNGRALLRPAAVAAAAVAAIVSFNALSYLKFGTFEGCPLRLNVQYDQARLARIDGRPFHLANFFPNAASYLLRAGLVPRASFPYLVATAPDVNTPGAKLDLTEPTVTLPIGMPVLTLLATVGAATAFTTARRCRPALLAISAGALPASGAMFCAVAVTHRYTADFCPWLIASGSFGLAALEARSGRWQRALGAGLVALLGLNLAFMLALTFHHQGEVVWGVATEWRQNYARLREKADRLFGRRDPAGYDVSRLPVRTVDASVALYLPRQLAASPATRPTALALGEAVLRNHPDLPEVFFAVGELNASSEGGLHRAIACFERGLQLNPNHAFGHMALADGLIAANRIPEGIDHYLQALRLNPDSAQGYNNLGLAYVRLNRLDEALPAFEHAFRLDPGYHQNLERIRADLKSRR